MDGGIGADGYRLPPTAYAWDIATVLQVGALIGADLEMLAELAGEVEAFVLRAWQGE